MTSETNSIELPYGDTAQSAKAPGKNLGAIDIADAPPLGDPVKAIRDAIRRPIGLSASLVENVSPGERVVIVVSDSFRQTRADQMLPPLLDALHERGARDEDIEILFSTGTHRPPAPNEQWAILGGSVFDRLKPRLHNHNAHDPKAHVFLGTTSHGTPVEVNRRAAECDRLFVTGGVVLHYFGGFGGGRKSIVPGLASARTIAHNHSLNLHPTEDRLDPAVRIGALAGNPVAEDMLEATRMVRVEGILNTVLTRNGEIAGIFAGELEAAHERACQFARGLYAVPIRQRADLVIAASATTKNYVQTHKALFNAYQALKPGGRIVLLAPCPEGLGGEQFAKWLDAGSPSDIIAALRRESDINGQTALSTKQKAPQTIFVTELSNDEVEKLGGRKAPTLQQAVDLAASECAGEDFYVMPNAAYTVPVMEPEN